MRLLLRSELLRARSRRVVPLMVVGALFGISIGVIIGTIVADPKPTPQRIHTAERQYHGALDSCLTGKEFPLEESGYATYEQACEAYIQPDGYLSGLKFADLDALLAGTASLVVLLGALLGSTLGGADWSVGTMTTLLTWEPRRLRVYAARAAVVAVLILAIAIFAQVVLSLAVAGAVAMKGTYALTPAGFIAEVAVSILRVSAVAALFGLIGLAFATVGRSSVAAVGTWLGYLIVVEGFIAAWVFGVARFALIRSATVATSGDPMQIVNARRPYNTFMLQPGRAWLTVAGWVVLTAVVAVVAFRGRDVT